MVSALRMLFFAFLFLVFSLGPVRAASIPPGGINVYACATTVEVGCDAVFLPCDPGVYGCQIPTNPGVPYNPPGIPPQLQSAYGIGSAKTDLLSYTPPSDAADFIGSSSAEVSATGLTFHGNVQAVSPPASVDGGVALIKANWFDTTAAVDLIGPALSLGGYLTFHLHFHFNQAQGKYSSTIDLFNTDLNGSPLGPASGVSFDYQNGISAFGSVKNLFVDQSSGQFSFDYIAAKDPSSIPGTTYVFPVGLTWMMFAGGSGTNLTSILDATNTLGVDSIYLSDAKGDPVCCGDLSAASGIDYPYVQASSVPEPATGFLVGAAVLGIAGISKYRLSQ